MERKRNKLLVQICGPTAVGKSALALSLAKRWETAILSADSRQAYQEINIGTAKPTIEERQQVPHYFVDQFPLEQRISARDFEELGNKYLDMVLENRDWAIVCGGTGLYLQALIRGLDTLPEIREEIQQEIESLYQRGGKEALRKAISQEDPLFFDQGESLNPARLIRALAVKRASGKSILSFQTQKEKPRPYEVLKIGLHLPKELLYERIHARIDQMLERGLVEEARKLWPRKSLKSLQTVGYQELFPYFEGIISWEEALHLLRRNTRRYAKRQMTWFRKDPQIHWMSPLDTDLIARIEALMKSMGYDAP